MSNQASQALTQGLPLDVRGTYSALAERGNIPHSTVWYHNHGRPSKEEKAQRQQYLTPSEEKALIKFLLQIAALKSPVRIKFIPSLAFSIARQRSTSKAIRPPEKNRPQAFTNRHPALTVPRKTMGSSSNSDSVINYWTVAQIRSSCWTVNSLNTTPTRRGDGALLS